MLFPTTLSTVAGERTGQVSAIMHDVSPVAASPVAAAAAVAEGVLPAHANIVHGYDVEALVDAAMGQRPMPTAPMYLDSFGMPLTRLAPTLLVAAPATALSILHQHVQPPPIPPVLPSALDIANAALAAAYGTTGNIATAPVPMATRILVLSNMVMDEDLTSDEDYSGLSDEVREECAKYGQLRNINIPRQAGGPIQPSAIRKIFLEYATVSDAQAASKELTGRKFGDNVVEVSITVKRCSVRGTCMSNSCAVAMPPWCHSQVSSRKQSMLLDDCIKIGQATTGYLCDVFMKREKPAGCVC
jgi:RNA recognition motif. (a.k.a. RRM, RBD, or RNP domain)